MLQFTAYGHFVLILLTRRNQYIFPDFDSFRSVSCSNICHNKTWQIQFYLPPPVSVICFLQVEGNDGAYIYHTGMCLFAVMTTYRHSDPKQKTRNAYRGVVLLHDNARPYTSARIKTSVVKFGWDIFYLSPATPPLLSRFGTKRLSPLSENDIVRCISKFCK